MYGLDSKIKNYIDIKIDKNKTFLKNMIFQTEEYKLVSMFDSDMNANLSPERYFAEVNNRVNTLFKISKELNLVPAFLTITAPSEYHFTSVKYNGSTPRETALYLSKLWAKFLRLKVFRNMKNDTGHDKIYIRVYEPHKSGFPHLHAMIFVPKQYLKQVKAKFFEHFTKYEIKKVALKFIDRFDNSKKYDGVSGAIAYILKYMNKTFKNSKDGIMSNEAYYFAYHGIRRFITSQTLIPLWIYRKIKGNEDSRDMLSLTKQYKKGHIYSSFNKEYIMQRYIKKEKIIYDKDDIEIIGTVEEKILYQKNHYIAQQFKQSQKLIEKIPSTWTKQKHPIPTYKDGVLISHYYKSNNYPYTKHISKYKDFELYELHKNYDVDNKSYIKYLAIENLMIDRGLLNTQKHDLNNFDMDKFFLIEKAIYDKKYKWYSAKCIGLVL